MRKTRLFLFLAILLCTSKVFAAHSFSAENSGKTIYYTITSTTEKTVRVDPSTETGDTQYSGAITIPNSVTYNGNQYFVTEVYASAFANCAGLTSVAFGYRMATLGNWAFSTCSNLTTVTFAGENLTTLPKGVFIHCTNLTTVTFPSKLTTIGDDAFNDCPALTSMTIPSTVTTLGERCFIYCGGLQNIIIPNSVTTIKISAFYGCSNLTSLTIPSSVTSIGSTIVYGCTKLTAVNSQITTPSNVTLGTDAFTYVNSSATLNIPNGTKSAYNSLSPSNWGFTKVHEAEFYSMSSVGYATYCSSNDLDFSADDGLDAYVATSYTPSTGTLTVTQRDKIPAGTGILLKGTASTTFGMYIITLGTAPAVGTNMFVGTNTATSLAQTAGTNTNLVLANVSGILGFYNVDGTGTLAAHRAYLQLPTSQYTNNVNPASSKQIIINFEKGGTTDIQTVELNSNLENIIYNLQGQRVQNPEHGIYIVGGKKTYIK